MARAYKNAFTRQQRNQIIGFGFMVGFIGICTGHTNIFLLEVGISICSEFLAELRINDRLRSLQDRALIGDSVAQLGDGYDDALLQAGEAGGRAARALVRSSVAMFSRQVDRLETATANEEKKTRAIEKKSR